MEFFNRKEEVLDIELTQYGKYLLSVGKFKPSYYAFFDDDVIYDRRYQGLPPSDDVAETSPTENQKDSQKRIQETPRIKSQHNFLPTNKTIKQVEPTLASPTTDAVVNQLGQTGVQPDFGQNLLQLAKVGKTTALSDPQTEINFAYPSYFKNDYYGVSLPLGTSDHSSIYVPAWQINFMQGQLKSSVSHDGGDGDQKYGIKKIPQLEIEVTFDTSVGYNNEADLSLNVISQESPGSPLSGINNQIFPNGSFVKIIEDYIILDVQELNSLIGGEYSNNFDIEVYEIMDEGTENESLRQLSFLGANKPPSISYPETDNIQEFFESHPEITPSVVDYFFEVSVDKEIQLVYDYENTQTNTAVNDLEPCEDDV